MVVERQTPIGVEIRKDLFRPTKSHGYTPEGSDHDERESPSPEHAMGDKGRPRPSESSKVDPVPKGSGEAEIMALRSGKVEPTHLGVGWSCSHALDCSDELMLMTISSSSSGTLVLVPDSSPEPAEE